MKLTEISEDFISLLLSIERSVAVWSSLLPRLLSLPTTEVASLVATLDLAVEIKHDHFTPQKLKSNVSYTVDLQEESFTRLLLSMTTFHHLPSPTFLSLHLTLVWML